jgi:hypothetical protein
MMALSSQSVMTLAWTGAAVPTASQIAIMPVEAERLFVRTIDASMLSSMIPDGA